MLKRLGSVITCSDRFRASDQHELPPDRSGLALFQGLLHLVERQSLLDRDGELSVPTSPNARMSPLLA